MPAFAGPLVRLVCATLVACGSASAAERAAVIELFTSQGCSSCPPADELLAELTKNHPEFITLTLPVDYWDYIGWKDTLALPAFSARQKAYALSRGDNHVYTPQAVVFGLSHVVGSDRAEIEEAVKTSVGQMGAMSVPINVTSQAEGLSVDVGAAPEGAPRWGAFWLLQVAQERKVTIGRGENSGRTVSYTNVVRSMAKVGDWSGKAAHYDIRREDLLSNDSDSWVVVLQASSGGKPGPVLAAVKGR